MGVEKDDMLVFGLYFRQQLSRGADQRDAVQIKMEWENSACTI
ncbi:hypothetical protein ACX93W_08780 [Paenibacillus sp. CAU 1782]